MPTTKSIAVDLSTVHLFANIQISHMRSACTACRSALTRRSHPVPSAYCDIIVLFAAAPPAIRRAWRSRTRTSFQASQQSYSTHRCVCGASVSPSAQMCAQLCMLFT